MDEKEKIIAVMHQFEEAGLVLKDINLLLSCISDHILGIGLGEQGIVTSKEDVRRVLESGIKEDEPNMHSVRYEKVHFLPHSDMFASLCCEVIVSPKRVQNNRRLESRFFQSLTFTKEQGDWKICALHASTPVLTEEYIEAYPLKFAEKTLQGLRESIGEQVYLAEEQYRQAILSDTIAFYTIDFTLDQFEKCQCNDDICATVEPGTPYEQYILDNCAGYIVQEDQSRFLQTLSRQNVADAFQHGAKELSCEYRLKLPMDGFLWVTTTIRLIHDATSGHRKGILYVRDIDSAKREELILKVKATFDGMTKLYNKESFQQAASKSIATAGGTLIILDVDDFKLVNDTFGHPVGDRVLIAIADLVKSLLPADAPVGRLGGDEYGAFFPGACSLKAVSNTLKDLSRQIKALRFSDAENLQVSCSYGVAECCPNDDFDSCYRRADSALYDAKKSGKDRISFSGCSRI